MPWLALVFMTTLALADGDLPTKFSNSGSIANTRHNLTQSTIGAGSGTMNPYRNDYEEVCVYCHTPHGASGTLDAPLWNRTHPGNTYTTYDSLGTSTLTQAVTQPGVNSLTCLSCHDGTVAIDSIINMPNANSAGTASGNYSAAQQSAQDNTFLNSWTNASGADATAHIGLASAQNGASEGDGCLACHSPAAGIVGTGATDFRIFAIGTDLTNDHPVGITYPAARTLGADADFNATNGTQAGMTWYDDGDGKAQKNEIRFYDTGDGPEVECASCHDPHGVPSGGAGSPFNATFLRTSNSGSAVCQTCHNK
jgi:hypothetical protein